MKPRRELAVGLFVAAIAVGLWLGDEAIAAWSDTPWRLRQVAVRGAERLSSAEVATASAVSPDADYAAADPATAARALKAHDWIADARAARLPGGTLVLEVRERRALAATWIGETPYAVDLEGRPFAPLAPEEAQALPRLQPATAPAPREPDARLAEAIAVARALPDRGLALPREIFLAGDGDPEGLVLRLPGLAAAFVLGAEAPEQRVEALAELLAQQPDEVATAERVDLRFEDQAVLSGKADPKGKAQEAAWRGGAASSERQPRG